MGSASQRLILIAHNDLDGEASAAAYLRIASADLAGSLVFFAEPYNLHETMEEVRGAASKGDKVVIMDIGFNNDSTPKALSILSELVSRGVAVEWYDHHVWDKKEVELVTKSGVKLFVDRSTCGAGVVVHYASKVYGVQPDDFLLRLESAVCSADLWTWQDPLAPKLVRAANSVAEPTRQPWRLRLIEKLRSGVLWDEELESRLKTYLAAELRNSAGDLSTMSVFEEGSCRVAAVLRRLEPPSDSIIGSMVTSRSNANVSVMIKRRDFGRVSLSLRSRGSANVQVIAKSLGGGGHPKASGASLRVNALIYLLSYLAPRLLTGYVSRKVAEIAVRLGACKGDQGVGPEEVYTY